MGMHAITGRSLGGLDHIRQSIRDILTTRLGSRIERRDYGSLVPELIDQPGNAVNRLRLMAATVMAIRRWEPRVAITRVDVAIEFAGRANVTMEGHRLDGHAAGARFALGVAV